MPSGSEGQRVVDGLAEQLRSLPVSSLRELAVRGSDVQRSTNAPAGPWIGDVLNELLFAAAAGEVANEREPLLQLAPSIVGDKFRAGKPEKAKSDREKT